jgi:hypothetical protein
VKRALIFVSLVLACGLTASADPLRGSSCGLQDATVSFVAELGSLTPTPLPLASCTEGNMRFQANGVCCEVGARMEHRVQVCTNGQWVNTGEIRCLLNVACIPPA